MEKITERLEEVSINPFDIERGELEETLDKIGAKRYTLEVLRDPHSKQVTGYRIIRYELYTGENIIPPQKPLTLVRSPLEEELKGLDPARKRRFKKH